MWACAYRTCVTLQQNQVSHSVKFSKDIVWKIVGGGIICHKHFLMLFPNHICLFKNRRWNILRGALSITCSQSCWNLHFLLTNTDAHSDSGHQSFNLLWATLRAIRRYLLLFLFIDLNKYIRFWHTRISDAILAYRACVRACVCVCVNSVGCGPD